VPQQFPRLLRLLHKKVIIRDQWNNLNVMGMIEVFPLIRARLCFAKQLGHVIVWRLFSFIRFISSFERSH
jgi:hypothetical protein